MHEEKANVYIFMQEASSKNEHARMNWLLRRFTAYVYSPCIVIKPIVVDEEKIWQQYEKITKNASAGDVVIFYGEEVGEWFCGNVSEDTDRDFWSGTHIFCQYGEVLPRRLSRQGNFFVVGQTNLVTANAFSTCLYGGDVFDWQMGTARTLREKIFANHESIGTALIIYSNDVYGKDNRDLIRTVLEKGEFCRIIREVEYDHVACKETGKDYWQKIVGKSDYDLIYVIGWGDYFLDVVSSIASFVEKKTVLFANQLLRRFDGTEVGGRGRTVPAIDKCVYSLSPRVRAHYFSEDCTSIDEVWLGCVIQVLHQVLEDRENATLAVSLLQKHHFHSPLGNLFFRSDHVSVVDQYLHVFGGRDPERYFFDTPAYNLSSGKNFRGEVSEILDKINDYFSIDGKSYVASLENILKSHDKALTEFVQQLFKGVESVAFQIAWKQSDSSKTGNFGRDQKIRQFRHLVGKNKDQIANFYQVLKRSKLIGQSKVVGSNILQVNLGVEDIECNNTSRLYFSEDEREGLFPFGFYRKDSDLYLKWLLTVGSSWPRGYNDVVSVESRRERVFTASRLKYFLEECGQRRFVYIIPEENGPLGFESYLVLTTTSAFSSVELSLMSMIGSRISSRVGSFLENLGDQFFTTWIKTGAVMSRNLAHNLGSHVLSTLAYRNVLDMDKDMYGQWLVDDQRLFCYLQQRMAYLTFATTMFPAWSVPMDFVGTVMRVFLHQVHLLDNIAVSEGLKAWHFRGRDQEQQRGRIRLHIRRMKKREDEEDIWEDAAIAHHFIEYPGVEYSEKETDESQKDVQVRMPGGVIGQQAFFCILENVVRNAAKHGWAHPPVRTVETKTGGGNLDVFIEFIEDCDMVHFRVYDNISDVFNGFDENEVPIVEKWVEERKRGENTEKWPIKGKDISPLHCKQHDHLRQTIRNGLKDNSCLGLSEMRISAGLLLGRSVWEISEKAFDEKSVLDIDAVAVKGTDGVSHLGYTFDIQRGYEVLIVVGKEFAEKLGDNLSWGQNRVIVKRVEDVFNPSFRFDFGYVVWAVGVPELIARVDKSSLLGQFRSFSPGPFRSFWVENNIIFEGRMPLIKREDFLKAVEDKSGKTLKNLLYRSWIEHLKKLQWGSEAEKIPLRLFLMPYANDGEAQYVDAVTCPENLVAEMKSSGEEERVHKKLPIGIEYWKSNEFDSQEMRDTPYAILYHRHCDVKDMCDDFRGIYLDSLSASQDEFNLVKGLRSDDFATMTRLVETGLVRIAIADERVANHLRENKELQTTFRMMKIAVLDDKQLAREMDVETRGDEVESNGIYIPIEQVWKQDGLAVIDTGVLQKIIESISQLDEEQLMDCKRGWVKGVVDNVQENVDSWLKETCKKDLRKRSTFQKLVQKYRGQFDILIIHQGLIDKWFRPETRSEQHETVFLEMLRRLIPYVVITTGRGRPANIPETARVLPFEVISSALFKSHPEKSKVVGTIMSLLPSSED